MCIAGLFLPFDLNEVKCNCGEHKKTKGRKQLGVGVNQLSEERVPKERSWCEAAKEGDNSNDRRTDARSENSKRDGWKRGPCGSCEGGEMVARKFERFFLDFSLWFVFFVVVKRESESRPPFICFLFC